MSKALTATQFLNLSKLHLGLLMAYGYAVRRRARSRREDHRDRHRFKVRFPSPVRVAAPRADGSRRARHEFHLVAVAVADVIIVVDKAACHAHALVGVTPRVQHVRVPEPIDGESRHEGRR